MAKPPEIPEGVKERVERAKTQIRAGSISRQECIEMWRGNQYVQQNADGYLVAQGTVVGAKPSHRNRTTRNLIRGMVEGKVSAASQRIPGYECVPSTNDPEDMSAARLATKVCFYGYDKWGLRRVAKKTITSALVMDGGYAMPYWDTSVGPYLEDNLGVGEVKVRTFTGDEVGWEPGLEFDESPYHVIVQARSIDEVMAMPGFIKDEKNPLKPDAASMAPVGNGVGKAASQNLVMVTEYLERPCAKYKLGRRIVVANERQILPVENYPCADYGFQGICLHPLTYTVDPDNDRDMGMVSAMLSAQRTYNNATNQQISWAQLALNPQIIGPPMANKIKFTDEPGAYYTVVPINGMVPQWREVPPMPAELSQMKEEAKLDMMAIAGADDIPDQVESSKAIQAVIEQSRSRWASFLSDLADWHSSLMRHCLQLVQHYYTEDRLLNIRGRFGWEPIEDFQGSQLRDQIDVMVNVGSIEPRTRQFVEQRVQWIVQTFPGYVSPEAAMAAIEGGTGEKLIDSYELDVARAQDMLKRIIAGPEILFSEPLSPLAGQVDPVTGMPIEPPSWAPREFDNVGVHMHIFGDYMKTPDYGDQPPEVQQALRLYWEGCKFLKTQQQIQEQMQQAQMAEGLGMANAAGPQSKPMPSLPSPGGS